MISGTVEKSISLWKEKGKERESCRSGLGCRRILEKFGLCNQMQPVNKCSTTNRQMAPDRWPVAIAASNQLSPCV